MAWNQPSGKNDNPWGRRPGTGGDLEERLKGWQRRLESMLRPGGEGGSERGMLVWVALGVLLFLWLFSGCYPVGQAERGVVQRFGRLTEVTGSGLHWHLPWPIETVTKVNIAAVNSSDFKSRVLTSDVNLVDLHFAVQYQFTDPVKKLFRVREPSPPITTRPPRRTASIVVPSMRPSWCRNGSSNFIGTAQDGGEAGGFQGRRRRRARGCADS